jgi:hypothetical protein
MLIQCFRAGSECAARHSRSRQFKSLDTETIVGQYVYLYHLLQEETGVILFFSA